MQVKLRELGLQDAKLTAATDVQVWDESIVRTREILRRTGLDLN
jgi:hypothetical protein